MFHKPSTILKGDLWSEIHTSNACQSYWLDFPWDIFLFLILLTHRLLFSTGKPPKLHLHEFRLFVLISYFKCLLHLPLRNFRGGSTVSRAGLLAATRVMVPTEMWPGEKTLFDAQPILYVYVTDGQNGAYFSAPLFDSIEINGHFRHLLSGGWCLKMYFLFPFLGYKRSTCDYNAIY